MAVLPGMWPNKVIASATRCGRNPLKSFAAGSIVTLLMLVGAALIGQAGGAPGGVAAFGLVSLYVIFSGIGVAGLATHVGQRLSSPADDRRPWAATLRGGVVLNLAFLIPLVGWFVVLPACVILGAGAATVAVLWPRTARVTIPPQSPAVGYAPPLPAPHTYAGHAPQQPAEVLR